MAPNDLERVRTPRRAARTPLRLASSAPGRVRWRTPKLHAPQWVESVAGALRAEKGVDAVEVNPLTASVVVTFDPRVDVRRIEEAVLRALQVPAAAGAVVHEHHEHHHDHAHHDHDHSPRSLLRDALIGGAMLAWTIASRWSLVPLAGPVTTLVALYTARRYFAGAFEELRHGKVSTDVLVSAGVTSSALVGEPITALSIVFLLNLGEYGHAVTLRRTRTAIRNLLTADDGQAWLVTERGDERRPVSTLSPGDVIAVYSGERIAADGEVVAGVATIHEASLTGESTPVVRGTGERVCAGTIVVAARGPLHVRIEHLGADTAIGRLIRRVEEAESLRAPMELVGDRFAGVFVPSAIVLALGVLLFTGNVSSAVAILLMACPCAVGLATPSPVSAVIGNAARRGILIKGGANVEAAATIDTLVFDKTGTLTLGKPLVARTIVLSGEIGEEALIALAASAIHHSHHPLSRAIVEHAKTRGLPLDHVSTFVDHPGEGVFAELPGGTMLVGSARLLERYGVSAPPVELDPAESVVYVAAGSRPVGVITLAAPLRGDAALAIAALRSLVREFVILTGDRAEAAASVANNLGISEWRAAQSPEEKYTVVRDLRARGRRVAMIGDGINDAPSLASADLGIAIATSGADVAVDAAGLVLASDDLRSVATSIQLSRRAVGIIRQNYALSFGVNAAGIIAAMFGLVSPIVAAVLHNAGAIAVVANSSRLIHYEPRLPEGAIDITPDSSCILSATPSA